MSFRYYADLLRYKWIKVGAGILGLALLIFSFSYLPRKLNPRYDLIATKVPPRGPTLELAQRLAEAGIDKNSQLLIIPDNSPNVGLYYFKRHGWSDYLIDEPEVAKWHYLRPGIDYVVIIRPEVLRQRPWLAEKLGPSLINLRGMSVYQLDH